MSAPGLEQMLSEIYASELARGSNPFSVDDSPFVSEWKRQTGYYGHNPVVGNEDPFATIHYEPHFRFLDNWWRRYSPQPEPEPLPEEEEPILPPANEDIGGDSGIMRDPFVDMRDPGFVGRDAFPGMDAGKWVGGNMNWKDALGMLGSLQGGGLLGGMFGTKMSTFKSRSGQDAISAISEQLGLDANKVNSSIAEALGFSSAPEAQKKTGGFLGEIGINLNPFASAPGEPNIKGMMAGEIAGYPATWENLTFNNIVNERGTIAGVIQAQANPNEFNWGAWGPDKYGNWTNSQPYMIDEFSKYMGRLGLNINNELPELQMKAVQSIIDGLGVKPANMSNYEWVSMNMDRLRRNVGSDVVEKIARGEAIENAADAGRLAGYATDGYKEAMRDWAAGKMEAKDFEAKQNQYEAAKASYQSGDYAKKGKDEEKREPRGKDPVNGPKDDERPSRDKPDPDEGPDNSDETNDND